MSVGSGSGGNLLAARDGSSSGAGAAREASRGSKDGDDGLRRVSWAGLSVRSDTGASAPVDSRPPASRGKAPPLGIAEMESLKMRCMFEEKQIAGLWARFHELDVEGDGEVTWEQVGELPEFKFHPLRQRLLDTLAAREAVGSLTFGAFLAALSPFAVSAPHDEKTKLAFQLWDDDGDGVLSREDIEKTLRLIVQPAGLPQAELQQKGWLTDAQLELVVARLFEEQAAQGSPDAVTLDGFSRVAMFSDLAFRLTFADL